jgi:hypothetical protein
MEPKDGGQLKKVVDITTKRPATIYGMKSKMGMIVCRATYLEGEVDQFVDCVEMAMANDGRKLVPVGMLIGSILELPGDENYNEYFLFELNADSPYVAEYRRVMTGIVEPNSDIMKP